MNDYWHISRASLSPSSASSAVSSASSTQRSNRSQNKQILTPTHHRQQKQQQQQQQHLQYQQIERGVGGRRDSDKMAANSAAATEAAVLAAAKRGSRSSQGSSDSNNSTRSANSGSLLLTAANLENMAEIYKKQHQQQQIRNTLNKISTGFQMPATHQSDIRGNHHHHHQHHHHRHHLQENTVIHIDPNLNFIKTKDLDTVSIASSMHFTMVNGEDDSSTKIKKGLCDRGRQVTVLILTMSTIFLLLIIGMVYALEMRAREMPQS